MAYLFGYATIAVSFFMYQQKKRERILACKMSIDVLWTIHYAMLYCGSAAATSLICILRDVIFYNRDKKIFKSRLWLLLFAAIFLTSAIITWEDMYSVFPAMASLISSCALWSKKPNHTRALMIPSVLCTLIYNIVRSKSPATYLAVAISLTSILLYFIRQWIKGRSIRGNNGKGSEAVL